MHQISPFVMDQLYNAPIVQVTKAYLQTLYQQLTCVLSVHDLMQHAWLRS